eukprot:6315282-Alexandrium_andersonii.AAC.1
MRLQVPTRGEEITDISQVIAGLLLRTCLFGHLGWPKAKRAVADHHEGEAAPLVEGRSARGVQRLTVERRLA